MYKLVVFVPETDKESVKTALFAAGAGRMGNYDSCCWESPGQGQFRPLAGATPHIGTVNNVEMVAEYRIEMVCERDKIAAVVAALRTAHPYEEPAFDVINMVDVSSLAP